MFGEIMQFPFGVPATALITVWPSPSNPPQIGDKITIDGEDFVYGTDFVGITPTTVSASLAKAIRGEPNAAIVGKTSAFRKVAAHHYGRGYVRVYSTLPGENGNGITITTNASSVFSLSGAVLSGGTSSPTLSINTGSLETILLYNDLRVTGLAYRSQNNFARPNDTNVYGANDVISTSTSAPVVIEFENVGLTDAQMLLTNARLRIDGPDVISGMAGFRLHLYNTSPTAINDNAAFDLPSGDRSKYIGYVDFGTPLDLGATLWSQNPDVRMQFKLTSTSLFGILQTLGGYTPVAQTNFDIILSTTLLSRADYV